MKTKIGGVRTWIEVDTKALKNNYESFRKLLGGRCKLMAIVKSNAYGHSLVDYSKEMEGLGCDFLGVDSITEAIALRREGIKIPILVLGYTLPELHSQAVGNSISLTISTVDSLKEITQFSQKFPDLEIKIHIKIDSGMHRQGFCLEEIDSVIKDLKSKDNIKIEGVYTHFAAAKNPAFPADTKKQILEFNKGFNLFKEEGLNPIKHAAATSGSIVFPDSHFDMVRIGIGLYGLWPSLEVKSCFGKDLSLRPALSWRSIVSETKEVAPGQRIGYDFTESLNKKGSKIAIIPIGYWHGLRRNLSGIGHVLIRGQRAKIIGRVSMDMIVVDITDIRNTKVGDVVTVLGKDGKEDISAEEIASLSETSWYETITSLNPLIKRVYL